MKQWKKAIGIVLAGVVLLTGIALPKNNAMADGKNYGIQSPRVANGVTTWDKIKFGSYNQEGTFRAEPIKWRVLSVDGDDALLLADQCLDARAYHDEKDEKIICNGNGINTCCGGVHRLRQERGRGNEYG